MISNPALNRRAILAGIATSVPAATVWKAPALAAAPMPEVWESVREAAQRAIASKQMPGISLAVYRGHEPLFCEGFGLANLETGTPVTPDTVFRIASVTKQFVGALLVILEREGKLSLSDTLARYFPGFPKADQITLFHLATHTAGLANYASQPTSPVDERLDYYEETDVLKLMKASDPLFLFEPGEQERYSNTGYALLALVINKVCDEWWGTVLQTRILDPLGLSSTTVDQAVAVVPGRASGYMPFEGQPSGYINAPYISMSYVSAAGALRSTARDLCRWHAALLGEELLSQAELKRMLAPVPLPGGPSYYGLGVKSRETFGAFKNQATVSHGGRLNGFASHLWSFPESGLSVAMLCNSDGGRSDGFAKAFDDVRDTATRIAGVKPSAA